MNSRPPLRITHIDTGMTLRGGQRQMLTLALGLRERGHEQVIVCLEGSELERSTEAAGFRVLSLPAFDPWHAFGTLLWRQQINQWHPQIIHAHDGRGQSIAWFASVGLSVVRVATRRVTFFPNDRWTYRLKYGRTCHAVVAVSENIRQLSVQAGVPCERIHVIPDGIDLPAELPSAEERARLRTSWHCDERDFVVGLLGASTPEKGHDVALAAFKDVHEKLPLARLVIAGDKPNMPGGAVSGALEVGPANILRLGPIDNLADFFPAIDLFIMPSRAEGLGSSALWAMSYGVPVVATRVGGLPEIVAEGETGWLIPPGSPQALVDAILAANKDQGHRAALAGNARKRAGDFSTAIMVNRTEAMYYRLMSGQQP